MDDVPCDPQTLIEPVGPSEPAPRASASRQCSWGGRLDSSEVRFCLLQVAFLRYLTSQTEEDRRALAVVTGLRVGGELLNRITGQDKVDAYKVLKQLQNSDPQRGSCSSNGGVVIYDPIGPGAKLTTTGAADLRGGGGVFFGRAKDRQDEGLRAEL